jgi:hypothetical protein
MTPSKTEKETECRAGAGNVEPPASPARVSEKVRNEYDTMGSKNAGPWSCSGRASLKKGADGRKETPLGCSGQTTFRREQCHVGIWKAYVHGNTITMGCCLGIP